jgi:hypothetical protein
VSSLIPLLYLSRKAAKAKPREFGPLHSSTDIAREKLRAVVRHLIGSWILLSLLFMLLLDFTRGGPEDLNAYLGIVLASVLVLPISILYRIVRFALGH